MTTSEPRAFPSLVRCLAVAAAVALATLAAPAADLHAQQPEESEAAAEEQDEGRTQVEDDLISTPDLGDIDEILEGEEEVLGGGGYTYDPGERRDPFKSLLTARDRPELRGPRPEGIPGLLIDELVVTGIFRTARGWIAQVQAAEKEKSYLIKEGDQLYDGDVVSIARNEVVFRQIVQDPTALKPFREVVKKLNP